MAQEAEGCGYRRFIKFFVFGGEAGVCCLTSAASISV
jgi:hypothetical protein